MLRWMTPFLVAIFAIGTAAAQSPGAGTSADGLAAEKPADPPAAAKPADNAPTSKPSDSPSGKPADNPAGAKRAEKAAAAKRAAVRAASQLPPGLPRAHYNYRTTVTPPAAPLYVRRGRTLVVEEEVFVPTGIIKAYAPRVFGTPLLPSTLPGYYGTAIPTAMAALYGPYGPGSYTAAASSEWLWNGPSTWRGHREKPGKVLPRDPRRIWSPVAVTDGEPNLTIANAGALPAVRSIPAPCKRHCGRVDADRPLGYVERLYTFDREELDASAAFDPIAISPNPRRPWVSRPTGRLFDYFPWRITGPAACYKDADAQAARMGKSASNLQREQLLRAPSRWPRRPRMERRLVLQR
jgi:hypothetical protein